MTDYYIIGNSFAAPFLSETLSGWVSAEDPEDALKQFAASHAHPKGLGVYAAHCFTDANAASRQEAPLARYLSNHEIAKRDATKECAGGYSYEGVAPGKFRINDTWHSVDDPLGGRIVTEEE